MRSSLPIWRTGGGFCAVAGPVAAGERRRDDDGPPVYTGSHIGSPKVATRASDMFMAGHRHLLDRRPAHQAPAGEETLERRVPAFPNAPLPGSAGRDALP